MSFPPSSSRPPGPFLPVAGRSDSTSLDFERKYLPVGRVALPSDPTSSGFFDVAGRFADLARSLSSALFAPAPRVPRRLPGEREETCEAACEAATGDHTEVRILIDHANKETPVTVAGMQELAAVGFDSMQACSTQVSAVRLNPSSPALRTLDHHILPELADIVWTYVGRNEILAMLREAPDDVLQQFSKKGIEQSPDFYSADVSGEAAPVDDKHVNNAWTAVRHALRDTSLEAQVRTDRQWSPVAAERHRLDGDITIINGQLDRLFRKWPLRTSAVVSYCADVISYLGDLASGKMNRDLGVLSGLIGTFSAALPGLALLEQRHNDPRRPQTAQSQSRFAGMNLALRIAAAVIPLATYERSADSGGSDSPATWWNVLALVAATADLVIYQRRLHAMRELDRAQTARRQLDASHPRPLMASEEIDVTVRGTRSGNLPRANWRSTSSILPRHLLVRRRWQTLL